MTELIVAVCTAVLVGIGARFGYRVGAACLFARVAPCLLGVGVACCAFSMRWFWPFGAVTPFLLGAFAAALLRRSLAGSAQPDRPRSWQRWTGLAVGGGAGVCAAAVVWLSLLVGTSALSARDLDTGAVTNGAQREAGEWASWRALASTAHRGFVRHLPGIGPLSDEVDALVRIVEADDAAKRRLARARGWGELVELPAMREALADEALLADIDRVRSGGLIALYRLQRNPRVLALLESDEIETVAARLRPTVLARGLAER